MINNPINVIIPFMMINSLSITYSPKRAAEFLTNKKQTKGEITQMTGTNLS